MLPSVPQTARCLASKNVLFVADSTTRELFEQLAANLNLADAACGTATAALMADVGALVPTTTSAKDMGGITQRIGLTCILRRP